MKTRQTIKGCFIVVLMFLSLFYVENFYAVSAQEGQSIMASKVETRLQHARELLGSQYKGSLVEKSAETNPSVSKFVYSTVQRKLSGKKWENQVANVSAMILEESYKNGFDPLFVLAVIQTESSFDPTIVGRHGEIGLMQIKPTTAQWIAQKENLPWKGKNTLKNPSMNIKIGIAYMAFLRKNFSGAASRYVAAYNMGPKNVRRLAAQSKRPRDYPMRVMANYKDIYSEFVKLDTYANL